MKAEPNLEALLCESARGHRHLCPRQVLGVRMGLYAKTFFGLDALCDGRLYVIAETDGCLVDGLGAATHCSVGTRTMRIHDYGKTAATFVDRETGQAIRFLPRPTARREAGLYAPEARTRWEAMLLGYQRMGEKFLLSAQRVELNPPLDRLLSVPHARAVCAGCGEEIMNQREVCRDGRAYCRACAEGAYYLVL